MPCGFFCNARRTSLLVHAACLAFLMLTRAGPASHLRLCAAARTAAADGGFAVPCGFFCNARRTSGLVHVVCLVFLMLTRAGPAAHLHLCAAARTTAAAGGFAVPCGFFRNARHTSRLVHAARRSTGSSGSAICKRSPAIIAKLHITVSHIFCLHIIIPPGQVSWSAAHAAYPLRACVILQRLLLATHMVPINDLHGMPRATVTAA